MTPDILTAETARRAKLAEAARRRPREKGRFVAAPEVATAYQQSEPVSVKWAGYVARQPFNFEDPTPEPPPMRHETNGFTGLHTDTDAPRPWRLTAAWVLLGAAIGWLACVVVRSL
jgi:hypothetical protein